MSASFILLWRYFFEGKNKKESSTKVVPKLQPKHLDIIHVPVLVTFGSFRFHFFSIQGEIPPTYPTLISLGPPYANTAMELAPRDCCMILFAWNIYRALCEKKPSFILLLQISTNQIKLTCRYSKKFLLFQYFLLIQFKPCLCVCVWGGFSIVSSISFTDASIRGWPS